MAVDRWFIGGGAEHTPESARRLVYAATGGAEGVGGIGDLKIAPLAVPGAGVRALVGSALIRSNYVGGETQTYMGTVYQQETVAIAATGSGSGRSDLVVLSVEDPFAAGSPFPPPASGDIAGAPYVFLRVISGVPADTTRVRDVPGHATDTAIALARIDMPASTGTVTDGMIVDLRKLAQARRSEDVFHIPAANSSTKDLVSPSLVPWPASTFARVDIPEWATHAYLDGDVIGYTVENSSTAGNLHARIDDNGGPLSVLSAATYYNEQLVTYGGRWSWPVGGKVAIPEGMRGRTLWLRTVGSRSGGSGYLRANTDALVRWNVTWAEEI